MVSRMVALIMIGSRCWTLGIKNFHCFCQDSHTAYFLSSGPGPAYQGPMFIRMKEFPPAMIAVITSSSLTLTCSVTGSPTPTTAWYKDGMSLAGTKVGEKCIQNMVYTLSLGEPWWPW